MKMQEKKLKRFKTYSNIANVLFVLIVVFGTIFLLAALAGATYLVVTDYDLTQMANLVLSSALPGLEMVLPADVVVSTGILFFIIGFIALQFALGAYLTKSIANMFRNIVSDKTPFTDKLVKSLKNMGIALFIYAGSVLVLSMIMGFVVGHPNGLRFEATIDGKSILFGLLLFTLGEIFEFGMSLQQDSESIV